MFVFLPPLSSALFLFPLCDSGLFNSITVTNVVTPRRLPCARVLSLLFLSSHVTFFFYLFLFCPPHPPGSCPHPRLVHLCSALPLSQLRIPCYHLLSSLSAGLFYRADSLSGPLATLRDSPPGADPQHNSMFLRSKIQLLLPLSQMVTSTTKHLTETT